MHPCIVWFISTYETLLQYKTFCRASYDNDNYDYNDQKAISCQSWVKLLNKIITF